MLCADDDPDDRLLLRDAARECGLGPVSFVDDGEELLAYLRREGKFADASEWPWPSIVLLDLNMPRKDGREVLREIKSDPRLRTLPVVIMTTSSAPFDVAVSYETGASSYITKPVSYEGLLSVVRNIASYWFDTVSLPPEQPA
jgi:CheY-like chemotaxis protein